MRRATTLLLLPLLLPLLGVRDCLPQPGPVDDGFVSEYRARDRAEEYLAYATEAHSSTSPLNAIAHMERDRIDASYTAPVGQIDVGAWAGDFAQNATLEDTRDFGTLYMLNAYLGYGPTDEDPDGHPYITPAFWEEIRQQLLSFKMWYLDATPATPDPDDPTRTYDNSFYWTENHQIIYHTIQLLSGQRFPNECFTQVGFTPTGSCDGTDANGRPFERLGWQHVDEARPRILRWMEDRWSIGWVEWHSNIYYQKDVTPLLTLVEFADDEEIVDRASILLDQILADMAMHTKDDTFGVTHGRSAMKDKWWGPRNDTWGIAHLLFRQQDALGYFSRGDAGATLLARAKRYRLPRAVYKIAHWRGAYVDKERHSVWIDESSSAPDAPEPFVGPFHGQAGYEPNVPDDDECHHFRVAFRNPARAECRFTFWWGLGAWTAWQVVPLTVATGDVYDLWDTDLLRPFQALRSLLGPLDEPVPVGNIGIGQSLALGLWPLATVGLLKEANTYTYRDRHFMLSTVHDYRKGVNVGQVHAGNLTIDPAAMVFTQHPMNATQPPSEWIDRDEGEPGYWTGSASSPRSAQHENVVFHLYSPVYSDGGALGFFDYEPYTHAWVPQDAFDEIVQEGRWTFGRKGEVFFALYSWRATRWHEYDADELAIVGFTRSFDLVADGPPPPGVDDPSIAPQGPDNVWILEVGTTDKWDDFAAFRTAILSASLEVHPAPGEWPVHADDPNVLLRHFDVEYASPSQGLLSFGWEAELTVRGAVVPIRDYPRFDNPWIQMERDAPQATLQAGPYRVFHDWPTHTRQVSHAP